MSQASKTIMVSATVLQLDKRKLTCKMIYNSITRRSTNRQFKRVDISRNVTH